MGDKVGRKVTYMYNLALFTFGALICAFAPNIEILVAGRFIVGIGLGGELNTGLTIVSEFVSTRARGSSVAVVNIAAGGLGIFFSGLLAFVTAPAIAVATKGRYYTAPTVGENIDPRLPRFGAGAASEVLSAENEMTRETCVKCHNRFEPAEFVRCPCYSDRPELVSVRRAPSGSDPRPGGAPRLGPVGARRPNRAAGSRRASGQPAPEIEVGRGESILEAPPA